MLHIINVILQKLIDMAGAVIQTLLLLFPPSPFQIVENTEFEAFIQKINYFVPVYEFVAIMEGWLLAIGVYYLYSIYARWAKAIQ